MNQNSVEISAALLKYQLPSCAENITNLYENMCTYAN